jgi:uncharacterized protein (TIGR03437 family)
MRLLIGSVVLFLLAATPQAQAIVTLGVSNENLSFTGTGNNSMGEGQYTVSWGNCTFDGFNTTCTLSGPFRGLGAGGTYSFVVTYPGKGAFPFGAILLSPGGNTFTFGNVTGPSTFQATLAETNGPTIQFYSFYGMNFQFSDSVCTGVAATACSLAPVGSTPGATLTSQVVGQFDPTPNIVPGGAATAANYGGFQAIAPGTWIEIYGYNLANVQATLWPAFASTAPTNVGGTTVTVAGQPAYIDYVSPGQVNVQVPTGITAGAQPLVVTTAGGSSTPYTILVNTVEPGVLAPTAFFVNGHQNVVALLSNTLTYILPVSVAGAATTRAKPGQSITMYGIGFGTVNPSISAGQVVAPLNSLTNSLQITFAGVPATVTYGGLAPGYVGLYQFNVTVPQVAASDTVPIAFTLNGAPVPQTLVIAISN